MNESKSKVYKLPAAYSDLIEENAAKFGLSPSVYISMCVKFCHKTEFIPDESSLKSTKLISKFRIINQLIKQENTIKQSILEQRNTQISFIKQQEKDLLKPMKQQIDDMPRFMEMYFLKLANIMIETLGSTDREREILRKRFI